MRILTIGDSFTYGEELPDLNLAWPQLLANKCNASLVNLGEPASSNDKIVRKAISYLTNPLLDKVDLVVIGWSSPGRIELADEMGVYDVWPGYGGNLFTRDDCEWRKTVCEYISQYHNSKFLHERFLHHVILLQSFFKANNIKYVMLNALQNEYYKKHFFDDQPFLFEYIDRKCFLGFNTGGMVEWAYGLPKGPGGHFLEDGHKIVADKVYEHIRNIGWVS